MEWISVKDRLPEENEVVIIGWENTAVDFGRFAKGEKGNYKKHSEDGFIDISKGWKYVYQPTHWMPLPEPPKI